MKELSLGNNSDSVTGNLENSLSRNNPLMRLQRISWNIGRPLKNLWKRGRWHFKIGTKKVAFHFIDCIGAKRITKSTRYHTVKYTLSAFVKRQKNKKV